MYFFSYQMISRDLVPWSFDRYFNYFVLLLGTSHSIRSSIQAVISPDLLLILKQYSNNVLYLDILTHFVCRYRILLRNGEPCSYIRILVYLFLVFLFIWFQKVTITILFNLNETLEITSISKVEFLRFELFTKLSYFSAKNK